MSRQSVSGRPLLAHAWGAVFLGVSCAALSGCSLSGLDEFDIPACSDNLDCAPLNEAEGVSEGSCEAYQCRRDGVGCELRKRDMDDDGFLDRVCAGNADLAEGGDFDCDDGEALTFPGNKEKCDGLDNDCDGIVDEGVFPKLEVTATLGLSGDLSVTYGDTTSAEAHVTVASAETGSARTTPVQNDTPETQPGNLQFGYLSEQDAQDTEDYPTAECPRPGGEVARCSFAEAAVTAFGESTTSEDSGARGVVFAVNTDGCAHGQVRVGYLKGERDVLLHGPAAHSNIFEGVDIDDQGCTGASRGDGPVGAVGINAAGLPATEDAFPQALGVWLADSKDDHGSCEAREVSVEALGVWLESSGNREDVRWTNGTGDGVPLPLGVTRGDGRPAVIAVNTEDAEGYFVAYGAADGGIALHYVPRFAEPEPYVHMATEARVTDALMAGFSASLADGAEADEVSLTLLEKEDGALELGVAWLEGACDAVRSVKLERVLVDVGSGDVTEEPSVVVAEEASRVRPAVVAVESGFVTARFEHDGEKVTDESGYLVAWTGPNGAVELARVLNATGAPLGEPVLVSDVALDAPLLYGTGLSGGGSPRLALYSDAGEVFSGPATCVAK
jgi:hypothetical protein